MDIKKYSKLKSDIITLKDYIAEKYVIELNSCIDHVLAELNDLLFGIEQGQLNMPYKELRLASTWSAIDGAFEDDKNFEKMIYKIQNDIYPIRRYVIVLSKYRWFSHKKVNDINWLFPNLKCATGKIQCISYMDEDMFEMSFPNGYEIDLGFVGNEYIITITKNNDWTNINRISIKLRSEVEECLQKIIYKYENL